MKLVTSWGITVWFNFKTLMGQNDFDDQEFKIEFLEDKEIKEIEEFFSIRLIHIGTEMDGHYEIIL
ncbi:MAG: hypothetical protein ACHQYQ_08495 [Bacteriovoracales bacterium]